MEVEIKLRLGKAWLTEWAGSGEKFINLVKIWNIEEYSDTNIFIVKMQTNKNYGF